MAKKSKQLKYFRVAKAGETIDGRVLSETQIEEMASTYDPEVYGARINIEHLLSVLPDSPFCAQGDVVAAKTERVGNDLYLSCALDVTEQGKAMVNSGKKVFSSIEIEPNFAKTGKTYLKGLAFTDRPASLGTEHLKFSVAQGGNKEFSIGSGGENTMFSVYMDGDFDFSDLEEQSSGFDADALIGKFKAILSGEKEEAKKEQEQDDQRFSNMEKTVIQMAEAFASEHKSALGQISDLTSEVNELSSKFSNLVATLEKTPASGYGACPPADGSSGQNNFLF